VEQVNSDCLNSAFIRPELVEQANKMFEEQIEDAYGDGLNSHRTEFCNRDEYFVKTYGGNK
jgi:hypothetical protein